MQVVSLRVSSCLRGGRDIEPRSRSQMRTRDMAAMAMARVSGEALAKAAIGESDGKR